MSPGSWVIVNRETRQALFETFSEKTADECRSDERMEVLTAMDYLIELNRRIERGEV